MFTVEKTEFIPYYKIPRIIEAIIAIGLLVFWCFKAAESIKQNESHEENHYKAEQVVIFITNGAFSIIFLVDIISQISGDPMDYTPMFLFLVTASILYAGCATYIIVLIVIKLIEANMKIIIVVALSFLMTIICIADCNLLIQRKFGYT